MFSTLVFGVSLILSNYIWEVNGYLGDDMSDEDFALFVENNYQDYDLTARSIGRVIVEGHKILESSAIAGAAAYALKPFFNNQIMGAMVITSSMDFFKHVYRSSDGDNTEKRLANMEKQIKALETEVLRLRRENVNTDVQSALDYQQKNPNVEQHCREYWKNHYEIGQKFRDKRFGVSDGSKRYFDIYDEESYQKILNDLDYWLEFSEERKVEKQKDYDFYSKKQKQIRDKQEADAKLIHDANQRRIFDKVKILYGLNEPTPKQQPKKQHTPPHPIIFQPVQTSTTYNQNNNRCYYGAKRNKDDRCMW